MQTPFSPLSFGKGFMKICSAVPNNGCLVFCGGWKKREKTKKKTKTNICKTYMHPPHRRLHKKEEEEVKAVMVVVVLHSALLSPLN